MNDMTASTTRMAYANVFAKDIVALSGFYSELLGLPELTGRRSAIYRCLDAGGMEFGFNAAPAYDLLGLGARKARQGDGVSVYFTFEVDSPSQVDRIAAAAEYLGGQIVKQPYDTIYNARQVVLEDPEGHVFRVNHRRAPATPAA
ncbi:hypothetical protein HNR60_004741 [Rhodopseudomonas rhenobacensis]|uniref:Glyoxalase-like domain-containing protein n=1 Tax=Rhodopseudomonas rhenobacensis TaxID=87461 RepID=A0A7W8E2I9_9BRAD|nr:VOC family protein [Rhodopseudomonas rhenobacensis]MBB5049956.1 hypothetical protein [Rhodopseudomonas rhenobacensis]